MLQRLYRPSVAIPTWSLCSDGAIVPVYQKATGTKGDSASVHWLIPRRANHKDGDIGGGLDTLIGFGFPLLPGQTYSSKGVAPLLKTVPFGVLLADKAFDTNGLLTKLDARGATAGIPPRASRKHQRACDREAYKWRHLDGECLCQHQGAPGRATRYDKTDTAMLRTGTRPSLVTPYLELGLFVKSRGYTLNQGHYIQAVETGEHSRCDDHHPKACVVPRIRWSLNRSFTVADPLHQGCRPPPTIPYPPDCFPAPPRPRVDF